MKNLRRRIERLERVDGGDFQTRLRLLSTNLGGAEKLIEVANRYRARLNREIGSDGTITWDGFCHLHDLGAFTQRSGD
jgi:hypothetical protein